MSVYPIDIVLKMKPQWAREDIGKNLPNGSDLSKDKWSGNSLYDAGPTASTGEHGVSRLKSIM